MRAPWSIRWPGHIKPDTVKNQMFASLDWVPTLVDIAGGPKGDELKKQIQARQYPGIVKTTLDGVDQRAYLEGTSENRRATLFFYYSGATPSAVRYKNWKIYFTMVSDADRRASLCGWSPITGPRSSTSSAIPSSISVGSNTSAYGFGRRIWLRPPPLTSTTGTCCRSASALG